MNGNTSIKQQKAQRVLSDKEYEYFTAAVKAFVKEITERFNIDTKTAIWNIEQELKFFYKL